MKHSTTNNVAVIHHYSENLHTASQLRARLPVPALDYDLRNARVFIFQRTLFTGLIFEGSPVHFPARNPRSGGIKLKFVLAVIKWWGTGRCGKWEVGGSTGMLFADGVSPVFSCKWRSVKGSLHNVCIVAEWWNVPIHASLCFKCWNVRLFNSRENCVCDNWIKSS